VPVCDAAAAARTTDELIIEISGVNFIASKTNFLFFGLKNKETNARTQ
jgi:hypothetical protein